MIRKLKTKFIMTIMVIITLILVGIIGTINLITRQANARQAESFLSHMANNDGIRRPLPRNFEEKPPEEPIPYMENEILFDLSNFYTVRLAEDNTIINWLSDRTNLYTDEEIETIVSSALGEGKEFGSVKHQYFYIKDTSYGKIIVFMDNRIESENANRLLLLSSITGVAAWGLLLGLSIILVNWMIKPVNDAFEKQKQFISDASHELKTPISAISTNADVLEREIGNNKWLTYIQAEATRINSLVQNLLTLANLEGQKKSLNHSSFDLSKAILSVALPLESTAFEMGKEYQLHIEEHIMYLGNEERIKQIAVILINNALKYSNDKGMIKISLTKNYGKKILEVYNTGQGIPGTEQKQIFERFYRIDKARNSSSKSYGLGLSIAKAIIEEHHGKITVSSDFGKWVKFQVYL